MDRMASRFGCYHTDLWRENATILPVLKFNFIIQTLNIFGCKDSICLLRFTTAVKQKIMYVVKKNEIMAIGNSVWNVYKPINKNCSININEYNQVPTW